MKIIDAHHHAWKYNSVDYDWISEDMSVIRKDFLKPELEETFISHQIEGSVLVQARQSEDETLFILELARDSDIIKGVVGWVDLQNENIEERLEHFIRFPLLKGFRHVVQSEPDPDFMLGEMFQRGIRALSKHKFTYDILIFPHQLSAANKLVAEFPDQAFVLDHIAKPYIKDHKIDKWKRDITALARNKNVYCKVSGMVTEANWAKWNYDDFVPYLDVVFEAFGVERIMYGSDFPVSLIAASYTEVLGIVQKYIEQFSVVDQQAIFRDNAINFYNL